MVWLGEVVFIEKIKYMIVYRTNVRAGGRDLGGYDTQVKFSEPTPTTSR
jgi:hypothetical protein